MIRKIMLIGLCCFGSHGLVAQDDQINDQELVFNIIDVNDRTPEEILAILRSLVEAYPEVNPIVLNNCPNTLNIEMPVTCLEDEDDDFDCYELTENCAAGHCEEQGSFDGNDENQDILDCIGDDAQLEYLDNLSTQPTEVSAVERFFARIADRSLKLYLAVRSMCGV